mmetsp:Transcript_37721/g.106622  ORF Transcript_37721/g.106622 Transcript_37721/m.106622 type:complete len:448 (+) Transcript_37721:847-2190(+)
MRDLLLLQAAAHLRSAVAHLLGGLVDVHLRPALALDLADHGALPALQPAHASVRDAHLVPLPGVSGVDGPGGLLRRARHAATTGSSGGGRDRAGDRADLVGGAAGGREQGRDQGRQDVRRIGVCGRRGRATRLPQQPAVPVRDSRELALDELLRCQHGGVGAVDHRPAVPEVLRALVDRHVRSRARLDRLDLAPARAFDPAHVLLGDLDLVEGAVLEARPLRVLRHDPVPLLDAQNFRLDELLAQADGIRRASDLRNTVPHLPGALVNPHVCARLHLHVVDLRAARALQPAHILLRNLGLLHLFTKTWWWRGCLGQAVPFHDTPEFIVNDVGRNLHCIARASKQHPTVAEFFRTLIDAHLRPTLVLDLPDLPAALAFQPPDELLRDLDLAGLLLLLHPRELRARGGELLALPLGGPPPVLEAAVPRVRLGPWRQAPIAPVVCRHWWC